MAKLLFPNKRSLAKGFTLIETMIAMVIFAVGVLALAALMSTMNLSTNRSRYVGTATTLATEKLEDLNHYGAAYNLPPLPNFTNAGDVKNDVTGYFDDVQIQANNGEITEVTYNATSACYDVFTHQVGVVPPASDNACVAQPPALPNASDFHRRWQIEYPVTVAGNPVAVRRVTVWVSLWNPSSGSQFLLQGQPLTFTLSTVRP